jgi:hypothetical protein
MTLGVYTHVMRRGDVERRHLQKLVEARTAQAGLARQLLVSQAPERHFERRNSLVTGEPKLAQARRRYMSGAPLTLSARESQPGRLELHEREDWHEEQRLHPVVAAAATRRA